MKKTKKNNKGFSLVELIVVVLIMAIIAVALAPQVMKWVGNSRTATDVSTYDSLYENLQLALTDKAAWAEVTAGNDFDVTVNNSGVSGVTANSAFEKSLKKICGADYATSIKTKEASASYIITVKKDGTVVKKTAPDGDIDPVTT